MEHRILLADSDREWLKKVKTFLEKELYTVSPVTNGKDAQLSLHQNNYFAIILGMGLKNHSGIKVMRFINIHKPDVKVIAMLDGTEQGIDLLEELNQYNIDNILPKPDSLERLKEELENLKMTPSPPSPKNEDICYDDDQFFKVKIENFYTSQTISFDAFIHMKKKRYIKIFQAGEKMESARLEQYRNNKQTVWLYLKKKDLSKYIKFQNFLFNRLVTRTPDKIDIKLNMLNSIIDNYWQQFFYEGINTRVLEQGKSIAQNIGILVGKEEHLMEHLSSYNAHNSSLSSQVFLITLFSTATIKKFKWRSPKTLETMALACLLHNIGMTQLPPDIMNKNTQEMTAEEWKQYRQHPELGVQLVGDSPLISHTIKQIILQHHEYYDGTGYPHKKRRNELLILANIVCLANDFVHTIFKYNCLPHRALEIFHNENNTLSTRYHPAIVRYFYSLFEDIHHFKKKVS